MVRPKLIGNTNAVAKSRTAVTAGINCPDTLVLRLRLAKVCIRFKKSVHLVSPRNCLTEKRDRFEQPVIWFSAAKADETASCRAETLTSQARHSLVFGRPC